MIIYIAGPMSGKPNHNRGVFNEMAENLELCGHVALNPASLPATLPDAKYLPICMAMIEAADAVFFLKGWQHSEGAKAEYYYAKRQRKDLFFEEPQDERDPEALISNIAESLEELEL